MKINKVSDLYLDKFALSFVTSITHDFTATGYPMKRLCLTYLTRSLKLKYKYLFRLFSIIYFINRLIVIGHAKSLCLRQVIINM